METCTSTQVQILANGSAITEDFILVGYTLKDGTKVFFNQTAARTGNGSSPQSYVPGSGASPASPLSMSLAAIALAVVALVS